MNPSWCSHCIKKNQPKPRQPERRTVETILGAGAFDARELENLGYAVVKVHPVNKTTRFSQVNNSTSFIHIDGIPLRWAILKLLDEAPNLKTIRIIPTQKRRVHEDLIQICAERGVEIVFGYHRPDLAWVTNRNISRFYQGQRKFFRELQGEQKQLFDELLLFGFDAALMTARYFCLKDEEFIPQHQIAKEFGYASENENLISPRINGVIMYLDPTFEAAARPRFTARTIQQRVMRLRELLSQVATRELLAKKLGLACLPEKLPLWRLETYEAIIRVSRENRLERLRAEDQQAHQVIVMRFGLDDNKYHTLEDVGQTLNGVTREWVRQLEERGLKKLGIVEND